MTAPARNNGDTIADQIKHHQKTDTDLSDVQHSLTDAHAHRPGLWQADLAKANKALHDSGILPGMDIVGTRGQDLVMKDKDGHTQIVDATNTNHKHQDNAGGNDSTINGRHAKLNPDGSGTVTAGHDDKYGWNLSKDLLKNQGIDNPTPNQMANYEKELEKLNGKKVSQFKNGEEIKVPPTTKGGDNTEFVGDRAEDKAKTDKAAVDKQAEEGEAAIKKFAPAGANLLVTDSRNMNQDDITKALKRTDLTDADKRGLEFLRDNYDKLATTGSIYRSGVYGSNVEKWKTGQEQSIEQKRVLTYMDSRD
jgi:hypothetical protein